MRAAAVLRSVALLGPIGVSKLRTKYGGRKRRGHKPSRFRRGSGSVLRKVLQQLEKAELIKFVEKGVHKGRVVAPKGASLLDKTSIQILKSKPKVEAPKKEKAKTEIKAEAKEVKAEAKEVKAEAKEVKAEAKEVKAEAKPAEKTEVEEPKEQNDKK